MGKQYEELRKLQLIEFDILKKFKEICDKHRLTYYLIGGTLLGAVRHKGFIPWDDDVDVSMPRPDYIRFIDIAQSQLSDPYGVVTKEIDESFKHPIARVINKRISVETAYTKNPQVNYVSIDIFPMDAMPENKVHYFFRKYHILLRRWLFIISEFNDLANQTKDRYGLEKMIFTLVAKLKLERIFNSMKQFRTYHKVLSKYSYEKGRYVGQLLGGYKFKYMMEREVYEPGKELEFEGELFRVPENYDALLRNLYGDYMTLPPEDQRDKHKSTVLYD